MPTRTHNYRNSEELAERSPRTKQVPLEALQMLTQSVSKCNQEYIHPLPFKVAKTALSVRKIYFFYSITEILNCLRCMSGIFFAAPWSQRLTLAISLCKTG